MALDATAAAAAAQIMADAWEAQMPVGYPPALLAVFRANIVAHYTLLFNTVFAGIVAHAVVSPAGTPPLSNGAGAVAGTGRVL